MLHIVTYCCFFNALTHANLVLDQVAIENFWSLWFFFIFIFYKSDSESFFGQLWFISLFVDLKMRGFVNVTKKGKMSLEKNKKNKQKTLFVNNNLLALIFLCCGIHVSPCLATSRNSFCVVNVKVNCPLDVAKSTRRKASRIECTLFCTRNGKAAVYTDDQDGGTCYCESKETCSPSQQVTTSNSVAKESNAILLHPLTSM